MMRSGSSSNLICIQAHVIVIKRCVPDNLLSCYIVFVLHAHAAYMGGFPPCVQHCFYLEIGLESH